MEVSKVTITVDGKKLEASSDQNLLHALLALGYDIPHFCYHPALGSVGACRLCAIKKYRDENDTKGRIVMSCMEPVAEGLNISVDDIEVRNFRKAVIESLMLNHPHDCPVCDEGGECHLQDMTVMTGHDYRRYNFRKRTFKNQYLGPFLNHEMNRCIQCYRCVRFYKDYAGGEDLNVFGCHDRLYFGRASDGVLESEFSGNLAEVCPTGVFTDKTLGTHYTRKWDLTNAPSICNHCSVGCNIIVCQRYGSIRRIRNRYNGQVNGNFICDRGRFGYEFINSESRTRHVLIRSSRSTGMEQVDEQMLRTKLDAFFSEKGNIIGIGSPRASLESNFSLRNLVGEDNFYSGLSDKDQHLTQKAIRILSEEGIYTPSLKEMEQADAVLILGESITNTAPMMALALRQASRNITFEMAREKKIPLWQDDAVRINGDRATSPLFILSPQSDKLDELAWKAVRIMPQDIVRIAFGVAAQLSRSSPQVADLKDEEKELITSISGELKKAKNPLIISGISLREEGLLDAAYQIAAGLSRPEKKCKLTFVFPECNAVGAGLMAGKPLEEALERVKNGSAQTAIILENNLFLRADSNQLDEFFEKCKQVIVLDHISTETTAMADLLLPVGTYAETTGTIVNNEGRAQRYYSDIPQQFPVLDSWRWLGKLTEILHGKEETKEYSYQEIVQELSNSMATFKELVSLSDEQATRILNEKIARQTPRYSGRTAMNANINVSEPAPPRDPDSPLAFSMEGRREFPPSTLVPYYWSPGWNSVQAYYKYVEDPTGPLKGGDPGIRLLNDHQKNGLVQQSVPQSFKGRPGSFYLFPVYHIYGSEEMSARGQAIKQRETETQLYFNPSDTIQTGIKEGEMAELSIDGYKFSVKVKIDNSIPQGVAGIYRNLADIPFLDLPGWGEVKKG